MHRKPAEKAIAPGERPAARTANRPAGLHWNPWIFYLVAYAASVVAAWALHRFRSVDLASLANLMGPLAENIAHGHGYVVCTDAMTEARNVLCYHAARMPLPPVFLALLVELLSRHAWLAELVKIGAVLVPVAAAASLAMSRLRSTRSASLRWAVPVLLLFCLLLPIQLVDVVNMQVEEGYSFCLLTYALAVLLFGIDRRNFRWRTTVLFSLSVLGLYLTKSSMIAAAAFLAGAFCLQVHDRWKRAVVLLVVACGPLGWGLYALHVSGHFSLGTSLDGINLHKGNYPEFLDRYPPADGGSLDRYDGALNAGQHFSSEWRFNRYHMRAAEAYIEGHPERTAIAAWRKAQVFFFSLRKIGSEIYSGWMNAITLASMVLFRLLLWTALVLAVWVLVQGAHRQQWAAIAYLGTVGAVAAPYIAGFALTRHAGVLILPSALFLSWCSMEEGKFHRV